MNKQRRADLLLVMTTFFWGASYYLTDICLADLPPMTLNAFRFIVAFLVLGLIFWKHVVHINRTTLRYSLIVGLALAGTYVAYNYGITRTSLSNAAFICALQVIFAPLLGFLFFRQRPGWKLGAALVVCTVGMALLTLNGELRPASGDLICLITPLCYAVDKQQIIDVAFDGYGSPIGSSMYPAFQKYFVEDLTDYYPYDPERARELLVMVGDDAIPGRMAENDRRTRRYSGLRRRLKQGGPSHGHE